jgi:hypothetical protein
MGPVQVLVVGFSEPTGSGEVLTELQRLRDAGIVRLIDLLLISHGDDGGLDVLPPPTELPDHTGRIAASVLGRPADLEADAESTTDSSAADSTWSLADAIPVGTTAAVALIEHLWAAPLRDAIQRSGGSPLDETWLAGADLELLEGMLTEQLRD